jgi:hypothetical protein
MPVGEVGIYTDPAHLEAAILEAHLEIVSQGAFEARLSRLTLGGFHLLRVEEKAPRCARVTLPGDSALIAFPTRSGQFQVWDETTIRHGRLMFYGPGARFRHVLRRAGAWAWIVVSRQVVAEWHRVLLGRELDLPGSGALLHPPGKAFARLVRLHEEAARLAENEPAILAHPEAARSLEHELIGSVVTVVRSRNG